MHTKINKTKVISSLFWKSMELGGTQGILFIIQIILARLLLPDDYGIIAIVAIFITISDVFVHSGFSTALVQKKNTDELDYSSVFYICITIACILYCALFFLSPAIAKFYQKPLITDILRVLSLTLFFGAVRGIQAAIISRTMMFKHYFFSNIGGTVVSGIVGISMAYMGYGVWALVAQQLTSNIVITLTLWFTVKWRPKLKFSFARVKKLFNFGGKLLLTSLLNRIFNNAYGFIIGKVYSPGMLGYFNRGDMIPKTVASNIDGAFTSVFFPVFSANQEDKQKIKTMFRRTVTTSSFFVFPAMVGLAICAKPIVLVLLTEKWLPCVPFMQLMCISYALWPINSSGLQVINALGHSDIYLKLSILRKIVSIIALIISVPFGIYAMASLMPIETFISTFINLSQNRKLIDYSYKEQLRDIIPLILLSLLMGAIVYCVSLFKIPVLISLILQISMGIFVYFIIAWLSKIDCFIYSISVVKDILKARGNTEKGLTNDI